MASTQTVAQQPEFNPSYGQNAQGQYDYNGASQNAGLATDYYPTEQSAMDAWFQANPDYANYQSSANASGTPNASVMPQPQGINFSSLFQPGYLGTPATVTPQGVNAPNSNAAKYDLGALFGNYSGPQQLSQGLTGSLGAGSTIQELLAGLAPQAQNATNNLNQTLADFGVGGGQAVGAQSQLQSQLMASIAPSIASAIQNSQGNSLQAGEFNTNAANTSSSALNSMLAQALGQNTSNQQSTNQFNAGNQLTAGLANQASGNAANQFNAQNFNATNAANVGEQNQAQQQEIADMLNQYYAQLGAFNQINTGGQGAANQNAVNFGQDITVQQDPFSQVFGAIAGGAGNLASGGFFNKAPAKSG